MSGTSIPYHLRQNKAIERNLFADLLSRIGRYRNISDYTYIGFGGPYLEDFRHIHAAIRIEKMISIEMDENVFERQLFNKPISCIELRYESSGDFVANFDFIDNYVVWLDYTKPADIGEQLAELEALVSKIPEGSVFKITVNANASSLGVPNDGTDLQDYRVKRAERAFGDYGPAKIDKDEITAKGYPRLLLSAIKSAAKRGVLGRSRCSVQPLTAFTYKDGQAMLAVTGIVLNHIDVEPFLTATRLAHWAFASLEWSSPVEISVPEMSFKERMYIESLLPESDAVAIQTKMRYYIGENELEASGLLSNFVKYYRMYPWYSRVEV